MAFLALALSALGGFAFLAAVFAPRPSALLRPRVVAAAVGRMLRRYRNWIALPVGVLAFHALEVNVLDRPARDLVVGLTGLDFAGLLRGIEGDFVADLGRYHAPWALAFLAWFYLTVHGFFLFAAPFLFALRGEDAAARMAFLAYPLMYALALPWYLFFPADNVTVHYGLPSALESVYPGSEAFYYRGTSVDNTLPSLHVGVAAVLGALMWSTGRRRMRAFAVAYAPLVVAAVLYLRIHWLLDCLAGLLLAAIVLPVVVRAARPGGWAERKLGATN